MSAMKAACLLGLVVATAACGATLEEFRDGTRKLHGQMVAVEKTFVLQNQATLEAIKKEVLLTRQATEDVTQVVTKTRVALEQKLAALEAKQAELMEVLMALRRGTQTGGGGTAFAELDVRAIGENHYRVSRKQFSAYTYELGRLAAQIPVVAHFDGDKRVGLRLTDSNGFLGRFGILAGDVLTAVNTFELRSPEQTREVFRAVKGAPEVKIYVRRAAERFVVLVTVAN